MPRLDKLKGRIKEKGRNYEQLSHELGISVSAFNNKVNGRSEFDIVEAGKLSSILDIPPRDIINFFT